MTVRIGIVGAGANAAGHARALARVPGARVTAVHDVDASRAAELAARCEATVAPQVSEVLEACDAVFVCTWTAAHAEIVRQAAAAGRAIFCEKPLAPDLDRASAMTDAVTAAGVTAQVGLPLRWRPVFAVLRHWLADPANGRVLVASLHSEMPNRSRTLGGWRGDLALAGGGMLLEVGFHDLDLLTWLLGPAQSLAARTIVTDPDRGLEDGAALAMTFDGGAVGSLAAVWHDAPHRHQARHLRVVCENAHFEVELEHQVCLLRARGPGERQRELDAEDLAREADEHLLPTDPEAAFVRAVREGRPATPDLADALAIHALIDTAYRSAASPGDRGADRPPEGVN